MDPLFVGAFYFGAIVCGAMLGAYLGLIAFFFSRERQMHRELDQDGLQ